MRSRMLTMMAAGLLCAPLWAAPAASEEKTAVKDDTATQVTPTDDTLSHRSRVSKASHKVATSSEAEKAGKAKIDRSGKPRRGKASFYARRFAGRKMADGTPMKPQENIAASKTLPLGTKAEVVNLDNGKSAVVEVRDRGPYVKGRIIDLSPKVASELDMKKDGVAPVVVKPLVLPPLAAQAKGDAGTSEGGSAAGESKSGSGDDGVQEAKK